MPILLHAFASTDALYTETIKCRRRDPRLIRSCDYIVAWRYPSGRPVKVFGSTERRHLTCATYPSRKISCPTWNDFRCKTHKPSQMRIERQPERSVFSPVELVNNRIGDIVWLQ